MGSEVAKTILHHKQHSEVLTSNYSNLNERTNLSSVLLEGTNDAIERLDEEFNPAAFR